MKIIDSAVGDRPKVFDNVHDLSGHDTQVNKIQNAIFADTFKRL